MSSSTPNPPELTSNHPIQATPEGYRGMIASSIDLVQSYSRSQGFINDNLPGSYSSFGVSYNSSRTQADLEGQWDDDEEEEEEEHSLANNHEPDQLNYHSDDGLNCSIFENEVDPGFEQQELLPPEELTNLHQAMRASTSHAQYRPPTGLRRFWSRPLSGKLQPQRSSEPESEAYFTSLKKHTSFSDLVEGGSKTASLRPISNPERSGLLASPISIKQYRSFSHASSALRYPSLIDSTFTSHQPIRLPTTHSRPSTDEGLELDSSSTLTEPHLEPLVRLSSDGASTFGQTLFNSFNILCGVGLLSEPFAFSSTGWVMSVILFLFCGLVTNYTSVFYNPPPPFFFFFP